MTVKPFNHTVIRHHDIKPSKAITSPLKLKETTLLNIQIMKINHRIPKKIEAILWEKGKEIAKPYIKGIVSLFIC
jgi:hypothetical protein